MPEINEGCLKRLQIKEKNVTAVNIKFIYMDGAVFCPATVSIAPRMGTMPLYNY
jgi:hypothetical protein